MEVFIRKVGNSKGIILPKNIIDKYHLFKKVIIIEKTDCIIIKPIMQEQQEVDKLTMLKAKKEQLSIQMRIDASSKEAQEYYNKMVSEPEIDLDIL